MRRPRKTYAVTFRPVAEADSFALYDYIAAQSGPIRAGEYIARLEQACTALSTFPERGTRRDDILPGLRTIGFERRATIAFRVVRNTVEIVAIAYAGRDFESVLRKP
jgi:toxin ParE1/3/4